MASSFPHSKYRKETSKQNSREDNHWSPSKPRSITLKRGGSSYQRNQHKPLSRQLMPGLVLSLSPSFFPSSTLPCYNLIRAELTLGGGEVLWRPDSTHSAFCLCSPFCCCHSSSRPLPISLVRVTEPRHKVCLPHLLILGRQCRDHHAAHNAGRWHFLTPEATPPPPSSPLIQSARPEFF